MLEEVYEGMEPAIKLNREIIKELQDDKKELSRQLRDRSRQLKDSNIQLQAKDRQLQSKEQKLENGMIKLIQRLKNEDKSIEAAREALEDVFSLDKKEAKTKAELYWEEK